MESVQSERLIQKGQESKQNQKISTAEASDFKRFSIHSDQSQKYNTKRKYNHSTSLQFDPDVTVKLNEKDSQKKLSPPQEDLSTIKNSLEFSSNIILMEETQCHQLHELKNLDQKKIMQVQGKLDEIVFKMKSKVREQRLSVLSIIKQLKLSSQTFELENLKTILQLRKDFYDILGVTDEKNKIIDILVSFPYGKDFESKQMQFKSQILHYFSKTSKFSDKNKAKFPSDILSLSFKDEQDKKDNMTQNIQTNSLMNQNKKLVVGKVNHFEALKTGNRQKFQQQLKSKIKQKEQKSKTEKQKIEKMGYESGQLLIVFDEIMRVFTRRDKSSMLKQLIIEDLNKSLNFKQDTVLKIFEILAGKFQAFFKVIQHKSGSIYQIQKKLYNQIRLQIQKQPTFIL